MVAGMLIRTAPQKSKEVYWKLKNLEGVANIVRVFGRYDLVLMIRALDIDAAGKLVAKIREVEGITYTETLIAAPRQSETEPDRNLKQVSPDLICLSAGAGSEKSRLEPQVRIYGFAGHPVGYQAIRWVVRHSQCEPDHPSWRDHGFDRSERCGENHPVQSDFGILSRR